MKPFLIDFKLINIFPNRIPVGHTMEHVDGAGTSENSRQTPNQRKKKKYRLMNGVTMTVGVRLSKAEPFLTHQCFIDGLDIHFAATYKTF